MKINHQVLTKYFQASDRLAIKTVDVLFRSAEGVAVSGELEAGDRLVLNDLIPAIEGMSLRTAASTATVAAKGDKPR